jgi:C4-dicarboxylate transporter, DctM subunit
VIGPVLGVSSTTLLQAAFVLGAIVLLGPLMLPLAKSFGMDSMHFCVFMMTSSGLGFIAPPMGLNLVVMAGLARVPVVAIAARAARFTVVMIFVSALIGFVLALSLFTFSC